jgi:hypothetical protein
MLPKTDRYAFHAMLHRRSRETLCGREVTPDMLSYAIEDFDLTGPPDVNDCEECDGYVCVHCNQWEHWHADRKCLFEPTTFTPRNRSETCTLSTSAS